MISLSLEAPVTSPGVVSRFLWAPGSRVPSHEVAVAAAVALVLRHVQSQRGLPLRLSDPKDASWVQELVHPQEVVTLVGRKRPAAPLQFQSP